MKNCMIKQNVAMKLFNGLVKDDETDLKEKNLQRYSMDLFSKGVYFDFSGMSDKCLSAAFDVVSKYYISNNELKETFFRRWEDVVNSEVEGTRIFYQILHYLTGVKPTDFEEDEGVVEFLNGYEIKTIEVMSENEFFEKLFQVIRQNIALDNDLVYEIADILSEKIEGSIKDKYNLIQKWDIGSKDLKMSVLDKVGIPAKGEDFFRMIANRYQMPFVKNIEFQELVSRKDFSNDLERHIELYGYKPFAEIFNRYKEIFVMMKNLYNRSIINKISRLSKKYHKPVKTAEYLMVTSKEHSKSEIKSIIKEMDISYILKLYRAVNTRLLTNDGDLIQYQVRNGKTFLDSYNKKVSNEYLEMVKKVIIKRLSKKLNKKLKESNIKIIGFDSNIKVALPESGKKFVGNFPFGSKIEISNNPVVGIHWFNLDLEDTLSSRVDLDLSATNSVAKIGWNSNWTGNATYSGDITNAPRPNGATELLKFKTKNLFNVKVNLYTGTHPDLNYKFFIGDAEDIVNNRMLEKSQIVFETNIKPKDREETIGIIDSDTFYFLANNKMTQVSGQDPLGVEDMLRRQLDSYLYFNDLELEEIEEDEETRVLDLRNPEMGLLLELVS